MKLNHKFSLCILICSLFGFLAERGLATSPPETYPMKTFSEERRLIEPTLQGWLNRYANKDSVFDLTEKEFAERAERMKGLTELYARVAWLNRNKSSESKKIFEEIKTAIDKEKYEERPESSRHSLLPFLFLELTRVEGLQPAELAYATAGLATYGKGTCAEKLNIFDALESTEIKTLSKNTLVDTIDRVRTFQSHRYKNNAFRRILDNTTKEQRLALKPKLIDLAHDDSGLMTGREWLRDWVEADDESKLDSIEAKFSEAKRHLKKRRCSTAKASFLAGLKKTKDIKYLEKALSTADSIASCYRRRGSAARRSFWSDIEKNMEASFAFAGWAEVKMRLGYLYWTADDFVAARRDFGFVAKQAMAGGQQEYHGKSVFALARIAENEGDFDSAIDLYGQYAEQYREGENFDKALQALVLLHVDREQWKQALSPLVHIISIQSKLAIDDRSTGTMSFALYWAGRLQLQLGQKEEALKMWKRGASEFYSTFYGALSHYMLEKNTGKQFALAPARNDKFRIHSFRESFVPADRRRLRRIDSLLSLGQADEALCEITELQIEEKPERQALLALLLHASGDWLDAIKTFDGIGRNYRHSLPRGFERILFPRRYVAAVQEYAKRVGVDPDFVLAIIRQESVFNPRAHSPAGARGLMQLMPGTAKLESRRLGKSYMSSAERSTIKRKARSKGNLFIADLNLALGIHHVDTLLKKYGNPIYALCAYNASPRAAERWRKNIPGKDALSFIERIPYKETRGYVKLILRNYFYYKRWYQEEGHDFPHLEQFASPFLAVSFNPGNRESERN